MFLLPHFRLRLRFDARLDVRSDRDRREREREREREEGEILGHIHRERNREKKVRDTRENVDRP